MALNRLPWFFVGALALTPSACERSTPNHEAAPIAATAAPLGTNVVTIVAQEYALQLPDTIPAGLTTFKLRNDGKQIHEAVLVRLDDGKTGGDVIATSKTPGPDPAWVHWVGGPAAAIPGSGQQQPNVTMMLAPGHYAVLCGIPGSDGRPHWLSGMFKDFTVSPPATAAAAPTSDAVIGLVDYDFQVSTPITASTHSVRITNGGMQDHHMIIFRLAPGKSMADLLAWLDTPKGPPPMTWASGAGTLSPGNVAYLNADFPPGEYVLLCFLPDTHDGKTHITHGMHKQFTVT